MVGDRRAAAARRPAMQFLTCVAGRTRSRRAELFGPDASVGSSQPSRVERGGSSRGRGRADRAPGREEGDGVGRAVFREEKDGSDVVEISDDEEEEKGEEVHREEEMEDESAREEVREVSENEEEVEGDSSAYEDEREHWTEVEEEEGGNASEDDGRGHRTEGEKDGKEDEEEGENAGSEDDEKEHWTEGKEECNEEEVGNAAISDEDDERDWSEGEEKFNEDEEDEEDDDYTTSTEEDKRSRTKKRYNQGTSYAVEDMPRFAGSSSKTRVGMPEFDYSGDMKRGKKRTMDCIDVSDDDSTDVGEDGVAVSEEEDRKSIPKRDFDGYSSDVGEDEVSMSEEEYMNFDSANVGGSDCRHWEASRIPRKSKMKEIININSESDSLASQRSDYHLGMKKTTCYGKDQLSSFDRAVHKSDYHHDFAKTTCFGEDQLPSFDRGIHKSGQRKRQKQRFTRELQSNSSSEEPGRRKKLRQKFSSAAPETISKKFDYHPMQKNECSGDDELSSFYKAIPGSGMRTKLRQKFSRAAPESTYEKSDYHLLRKNTWDGEDELPTLDKAIPKCGRRKQLKERSSRALQSNFGNHAAESESKKPSNSVGKQLCHASTAKEEKYSGHALKTCVAHRTRSHLKPVVANLSRNASQTKYLDLLDEESSDPSINEANASFTCMEERRDNRSSDSDSSFGEPTGCSRHVEKCQEDASSNSSFNEINYSGGEDDGSKCEKANTASGPSDCKTAERELLMGKFSKMKCGRAARKDSVFKLLVNTIWGKGEKLAGEDVPSEYEHNCKPESKFLPRKFLDKVPTSTDKSESENSMEELWALLDFAAKSLQIGSFDTAMDDKKYSDPVECETDPSKCCSKGDHEYIVLDNIGIHCKHCGYVQFEIRDIVPSLAANSWGRSGKKKHAGDEYISGLDSLYCPVEDDDDNSSSSNVPPGTIWDNIPRVRNTLYPHQREGLEFLWKNLAGSIYLEELKKSAYPSVEGGCVISHAPGTGKTRLTIVFLQTFMEVFPTCRPIIVAPQGMLLTWEREIRSWQVDIPFHNLNVPNFSGNEDCSALRLLEKAKCHSVNHVRLLKLHAWHKGRSVLLLSYDLFQKLTAKGEDPHNWKVAEIAKILLEKPTLVVLDEGHRPRNKRSQIWKSLAKIKTESRIILSGTPFQNNFDELYNTLCLVRPRFSTSQPSMKFQNILPRNQGRGGWTALTNNILEASDAILEELQSLFTPFVHVYKGNILNKLPGLKEFLIVLNPCVYQRDLLQKIQDIPSDGSFGRECALSWISVHPSLIIKYNFSKNEESVIDRQRLESMRNDPNEGVKTRFLMELVRLSSATNEKVLVFSQHVEPLDLVKAHLTCHFHWTEGKEVLQMDGSTNMKLRQSIIESFNNPCCEARVLLASTKACSEGISLIGASRVILLDVVWNPSVERQAISRAYRIGQQKIVYIYHLITFGTQDGEKFCRQAMKDRLSELVFSSKDKEGIEQSNILGAYEDKLLEELIGHVKLKGMFEKILYQPRTLNLTGDLEPS